MYMSDKPIPTIKKLFYDSKIVSSLTFLPFLVCKIFFTQTTAMKFIP